MTAAVVLRRSASAKNRAADFGVTVSHSEKLPPKLLLCRDCMAELQPSVQLVKTWCAAWACDRCGNAETCGLRFQRLLNGEKNV